MTDPDTDEVADKQQLTQLADRFRELYAAERAELERNFLGLCVVFNLQSGRYVVGKTPQDALERAKEDFGSTD